jgi:hypothetical protein
MAHSEYFRDKAKQCRMLADLAIGQWVSDSLYRMADEFEREAVDEDIRALMSGVVLLD